MILVISHLLLEVEIVGREMNIPGWNTGVIQHIGALGAVAAARWVHSYAFGPLHIDEAARLAALAWYTVVELGMAMVLAHEALEVGLVLSVSLFIMLKWFHCLSALRIEVAEAGDSVKTPRLGLILLLLHVVDFVWIRHYYRALFKGGCSSKSSQTATIFAFELAICYLSLCASSFKFVILGLMPDPTSATEIKQQLRSTQLAVSTNNVKEPEEVSVTDSSLAQTAQQQYHHRQIFLFVINFMADALKLMLYSAFSLTMLANYSLPLHVFRECYITLRVLIHNLREFIWFRKLFSSRNTAFRPINSSDDIQSMTITCLICRDDIQVERSDSSMRPPNSRRKSMHSTTPVKLQCSHILHYGCMMQWLRRNGTCPACRRKLA